MGRLGVALLVLGVGWPAITLGTPPSGRRRSNPAPTPAVVGVRGGQRTATRTAGKNQPQTDARRCVANATACPRGWRRLALPTDWCQGAFTVCTYSYGKVASPPQSTTILLHGLAGEASDWERHGRIAEVYRRSYKKGKVPSGVLAAISGGNGYWTDWADERHRYGTLIHTGLIGLLRKHGLLARSPNRVAVIGVSAGAFAALSLTLRFPARFGRVLALSATDMSIATRSRGPAAIYKRVFGKGLSVSRIRAVNPVDLVRSGASLPAACVLRWGGREAPKFSEGGRRLKAALRKRSKARIDAAVAANGKHGWRWWTVALPLAVERLWGLDGKLHVSEKPVPLSTRRSVATPN
mgnify:FL=1